MVRLDAGWRSNRRSSNARAQLADSVSSADAIFSGRFEWAQALIAVAALIALWRFRLGVMTVLGASALLGLAITYAA